MAPEAVRARLLPSARIASMLLVAIVWACPGSSARGQDNNIIMMVEQSNTIVELKLGRANDDGLVRSTVVRHLKGKKLKAAPTIALASVAMKGKTAAARNKWWRAWLVEFRKSAKSCDNRAVLFLGKGENGNLRGALHVAGRWLPLDRDKKAKDGQPWEATSFNAGRFLDGWDGGTGMLVKLVEFIVRHPDAEMVGSVGGWSDLHRIGKAPGAVRDFAVVNLDGRMASRVYAASEKGDRLYAFDARHKRFADVTARTGLASASRAAAWSDFDGNGRLDLASWDGKSLALYFQKKSGTFAAPRKIAAPAPGGCLGLTPLDCAASGRAGLLWSGPGGPVLLVPDAARVLKPKKLKLMEDTAAMGTLGRCLVADFDADGRADILQTGSKASAMYLATGAGEFAAPVKCAVATGEKQSYAFLGDFDIDGRFDVFSVNPKNGCALWQNRPGKAGKKSAGPVFRNLLQLSGEIRYRLGPAPVHGGTCDLNNDGRQDLFLSYRKAEAHSFFFNFGFRSMKAAPGFDQQLREAMGVKRLRGMRSLMVDLDGNGIQDMIAATTGNRLYAFFRKAENEDEDEDGRPALQVALPLAGKAVGPVRVTAWSERRCLGCWNVTAGGTEAFFALPEAGEVTVRWRLPGGGEQRKTLDLERRFTRFVIPAAAGGKGPQQDR